MAFRGNASAAGGDYMDRSFRKIGFEKKGIGNDTDISTETYNCDVQFLCFSHGGDFLSQFF